MSESLRRYVIQNAETSRLMGVGYVPMYRRGGDEPPFVADEPSEPVAEAPVVPVAPAKREASAASPVRTGPPMAPAARVEVKPVGRPPVAAPKPAVIAGLTPAAPLVRLPEWLPTCTAEAAAARTKEQAQAALEALRARYEADAPHRQFRTDHHSIVWGEGDVRARLMFVGEAPGEEEDRAGRPFVGRSGQLLDKMIVAMGLSRAGVYIANVLKTRPPDNATPTATEAALCAPYLFEQIAIVGPAAIVTLGLPATRLLLATEASMGSLRGRWSAFRLPDGRSIPVMPTYHPAYVLRSYTEEVRGKVWADLQMAMKRLGEGA